MPIASRFEETIPKPARAKPENGPPGEPLMSMVAALGEPVAILDETGDVLAVNRSWRELARRSEHAAVTCDSGDNYPEACEAAGRNGVSGAGALARGVQRVLCGRQGAVDCECRLIDDGLSRHFRVRISRVADQSPPRFLVQVQEVTSLIEAQETAREAGERLLAAQADERERLALELHDSVGQNLVSLGLSLSLLRMVAPRTSSVSSIIEDMSNSLQEAHAQIRSLSYLLNPPWPLHEAGLEKAVVELAQGFGRRAGLRVEVRLAGAPCEVDRASELVVFRVLQEALVNIHRHAHANVVLVELSHLGCELMLQVRDDGRGFAVRDGAVSPAGVGLCGMRARVRERRGEFTIVTGPTGTTLTVRLPAHDEDASRTSSPDVGVGSEAGRAFAARPLRQERSWDPPGRRPSTPRF